MDVHEHRFGFFFASLSFVYQGQMIESRNVVGRGRDDFLIYSTLAKTAGLTKNNDPIIGQ